LVLPFALTDASIPELSGVQLIGKMGEFPAAPRPSSSDSEHDPQAIAIAILVRSACCFGSATGKLMKIARENG
jgi:hypothetical protein